MSGQRCRITLLPQDLIDELIAIGAHEDCSKLTAIPTKYPCARSGQFMREGPEFWNNIAAQLPDDALVSLIKALTLAERELDNYKSGSVAPVVLLFRILQARKQHSELQSLEDWILSHTDNDYLPWGFSNHGAKSSEEYYRISEIIAARRQARADKEIQRQLNAKSRVAATATKNIIGAVRRQDIPAIHALRLKGANVSARDISGISAMQLAQEIDNPNVVNALTEDLKEE